MGNIGAATGLFSSVETSRPQHAFTRAEYQLIRHNLVGRDGNYAEGSGSADVAACVAHGSRMT
jgi:hypothetical protein